MTLNTWHNSNRLFRSSFVGPDLILYILTLLNYRIILSECWTLKHPVPHSFHSISCSPSYLPLFLSLQGRKSTRENRGGGRLQSASLTNKTYETSKGGSYSPVAHPTPVLPSRLIFSLSKIFSRHWLSVFIHRIKHRKSTSTKFVHLVSLHSNYFI